MKRLTWLATMAFVATLTTGASAQTDQGKFSGTVFDSSGGVVAGATVMVKNERTGAERAQTTSNTGVFLIANLKPSSYTVRAAKEGFAPLEYSQMAIAVGQELHLDFEFRPAGVQEHVTVVARAPIVDVSSARMGVNVTEREVNSLPVNGRQMSQLMLQALGAANAGTGTWQDIRFSGPGFRYRVEAVKCGLTPREFTQSSFRRCSVVTSVGYPLERASVRAFPVGPPLHWCIERERG